MNETMRYNRKNAVVIWLSIDLIDVFVIFALCFCTRFEMNDARVAPFDPADLDVLTFGGA